MAILINISPKTPRTLEIVETDYAENEIKNIKISLSQLTVDERVQIAAWALQGMVIK